MRQQIKKKFLQSCLRERDLLSEKLQLVSTGPNHVERTGSSLGVGEGDRSHNVRWGESVRDDLKPIEQAYEELKEEYKVTSSNVLIHSLLSLSNSKYFITHYMIFLSLINLLLNFFLLTHHLPTHILVLILTHQPLTFSQFHSIHYLSTSTHLLLLHSDMHF